MGLALNNVQIAGNLTRDVEFKEVGSTSVAKLGLAINRKYKNKAGDLVEEVTFVDAEAWGRQAELANQYLAKGRNVLIEGSLKVDQWQADDGSNRSKMYVSAQRIHFLSDGAKATPVDQRSTATEAMAAMADDPPF